MPDDEIEKSEEAADARRMKILDSHASQLAEHFDSVQIVVTTFCPQDGSGVMTAGRGNYYARIGAAAQWLRRERKQ